MSDPVSNAEIEDVLSSIRRLVSDDPSPLHRRKRIAEGAKERFVLTPALRVSEQDADDARSDPVEIVADKAEATAPAPDPLVLLTDDDKVTDGDDTAPVPQAVVTPVTKPVSAEMAARQAQFAESRQTLEQRIAELESALQESGEEWEPDGSEVQHEDSDIPSFADEPASQRIEPEDLTIDAPSGPDAEASEGETQHETPDLATPQMVDPGETETPLDLSDMVFGAPETVVEDHKPTVAPIEDAVSGEDISADTPDSADESWSIEQPLADEFDPDMETPEAESKDDTFVEPKFTHATTGAGPFTPDDKPKETNDFFQDESVLDEETLREMVSQLVRDELQGVLGERITRNVRRLVRREIQRAIAMRELE